MGSEAEVMKKFFDTLLKLTFVLKARYSCCLTHTLYAKATVVDVLMKGLIAVDQFENKLIPSFVLRKQLEALTAGMEASIADVTPSGYPEVIDDEDLTQRTQELLFEVGSSSKTQFLS